MQRGLVLFHVARVPVATVGRTATAASSGRVVRAVVVALSSGRFAAVAVVEAGVDVGLLKLSVGKELAGTETLTQVEAHVYGLDVIGGKFGSGIAALRLKSDAEDTQLIEIDGFALKQQLTQAVFHFYEYAPDSSLTENAVVVSHVGNELFKGYGFVGGAPIELTEASRIGNGVFVLFVTYHNRKHLGLFGTIAGAKLPRPGSEVPVLFRYGLFWPVMYCKRCFFLLIFPYLCTRYEYRAVQG